VVLPPRRPQTPVHTISRDRFAANLDRLCGCGGFRIGLPQMDRHEGTLLDQGDIPLPPELQAGDQSTRPGRTPMQTKVAADVIILGIDRRQESFQPRAVRQRRQHGQDALPRDQAGNGIEEMRQ